MTKTKKQRRMERREFINQPFINPVVEVLKSNNDDLRRKLDEAVKALEGVQFTACNHGGAIESNPLAEMKTIHLTATGAIASIRGETE